MKVIGTGDLHFDEHSRWEECQRVVCTKFVETVRRERPDVVLIAGDIYERASTPKERKAVCGMLTAVSEVAPVVITRGNHDREKDLDILALLRTKHPIHVVTGAEVVYVAGAAIAAMAWPDEASLLAAAVERGEDSDDLARTALRQVIAGLGAELAKHDGPRIAMGHFMVDGSVASTGQPLLGQPINVGLSDLALFGAHLGVMGHIHKAQRFDVAGAPFFYTGSQFRTTFGQSEKKTVLLAEFDGQTLVRTEEIDTGATPMVHIDGEWNEAERTIVADFDEALVAGAEVRFCYRVPKDQRHQARFAAEKYRVALTECGAVAVKVEGDTYVVRRADAPKVSRVRAIAEKLPLHWDSIGFDPGARRASLIAKAVKLEEEAGANPTAPTWVRLNSWRCKGFGPYRGEFGFDLTKFPLGATIGFEGPNGAGKSYGLEAAISGTCYREMPNHGQLVHRARDRDSWQEASITAGDRTWTIRHEVDAVSGKAKSLVRDENKNPAYESTKVKDFDAWAPKYLPHPDVLFATQVAVQPGKRPKRRFIDLLSSERISAALRVIGVERIEQMAALARAKHTDAEKAFLVAQQRLDDEIARAGDLDGAETEVAGAEVALEAASAALVAARETLRAAEAEEARIAATNEGRKALRERRAELVTQRDAANQKRDALASRVNSLVLAARVSPEDSELAGTLEELRTKLARAEAEATRVEEIRQRNAARRLAREKAEKELVEERAKLAALVSRLEGASLLCATGDDIRRAVKEHEEAKALVARAEREQNENDARAIELKRDEQRTAKEVEELSATIERLRSRLARAEEVRAAEESLPGLRAKVEDLRSAVTIAEVSVDTIRGERLAGAEERIGGLRRGLTDIAAQACAHPSVHAAEALRADDHLVALAESFPGRFDAAKRELREANAALDVGRAAVDGAELLVALHPNLAQDEELLKERERTLESHQSTLADVRGEIEAALGKMIPLREAFAAAVTETSRVAPLAAQLGDLEKAEAVLAELERQVEEARPRVAALEAKLAEPLGLEDLPTVEGAEEQIGRAHV